jgi:hypothetical protein
MTMEEPYLNPLDRGYDPSEMEGEGRREGFTSSPIPSDIFYRKEQ